MSKGRTGHAVCDEPFEFMGELKNASISESIKKGGTEMAKEQVSSKALISGPVSDAVDLSRDVCQCRLGDISFRVWSASGINSRWVRRTFPLPSVSS